MKKQDKVLYPDLSYKIVGCLFEIHRNLGSNHREFRYQNALKQEFLSKNIKFNTQVPFNVLYKEKVVGKNLVDFVIEDKIILEIKAGRYFRKKDFEQALEYLKTSKLKLAILANFKKNGVQFYRVLNDR